MKASNTIDFLYKVASIDNIKCEECNYDGPPLNDGRCPDCGVIGGIKAKDNSVTTDNGYSRNISAMQMYDTMSRAQQENASIQTMC